MKTAISLIAGVLLATTLTAAGKSGTFQKTYGSKEDDVAKAVIKTDRGFLIVGETRADRDRRTDLYVIHIDKKGNKLWSKAIGGRDDDKGSAAIRTDDGFVVVGTTESFGSDRSSIYTVKLDKKGDGQWQRAYFSNDESYYYGTGIARTSDGFKVVGWENKLEFFDSEVYGYVVDIDKEGERRRLRRYGGKDDDMLYAVCKTDGGYILAGATESLRDDDYGFDAYVLKVDEKGKVLWQHAYGWGYDESAYAIAPAKDGGFMITGITKSNRDKRDEVYVLRIDKNGKKVWQNTYGGRYDEDAYAIVADDDGYVIAGYTETDTHGREDVYLLKIDDHGKVLWQKNYGGRDEDIAYGIVRTDDGYLVVGETESYGNGRKDAYILKVDKEGNL